jgi:hypothetical protein
VKRVPAKLAVLLLHQEADARGDDRLRIRPDTLRQWVRRGHLTRGPGGYDLAEILAYLEQRERSTSVDDLITWLRAQLDEDERVARACGDVPWVDDVPGMVHVDPAAIRDNKWDFGHLGYVAGADPSELGNAYRAHIARHDPAHVLREVEAKRKIVRECENQAAWESTTGRKYPATTAWALADTTLRLLALPYADRPGYQDTWRPLSQQPL